jgi:hypothetical protein
MAKCRKKSHGISVGKAMRAFLLSGAILDSLLYVCIINGQPGVVMIGFLEKIGFGTTSAVSIN